MWTRSGCVRILGLVVAIGYGALSASRAEAGFTSLRPPNPAHSTSSSGQSGADFTPRCDVPDLDVDNAGRSSCTTAVDLPDAWDLRHGKSVGDDHLIKSLTSDKSGGKNSYSQFWEDHSLAKSGDQFSDFGVDVKSTAPVVVPLPQGVWAGLIGLVGVIIFQIRRHRRQLV